MAITLKDLEKVRPYQLAALQHIHDTCEKHGLKYTLWGGTALGAVRHGGFIPWDCDADVALLRPDFDKLIKILLEENGKGTGFFLQVSENLPNNYLKYHPVLKVEGTYFDFASNRDIDIHHGIFVDIFMLDYLPRFSILCKFQKTGMSFLKKILYSKRINHVKKIWIIEFLIFIFKKIPNIFLIFLLKILFLLSSKKSKKIISLATGYRYEKMIFSEKIIQEYIDIKFDINYFKIMKNHNIFLQTLYGEEYMKIPDEDDVIRKKHIFDNLELKI